jgi:hypothetical protein
VQVLESYIEDTSRDHASSHGWVSRKMNGLGFNSWPDRLFIPPKKTRFGNKFWVEFKRLGEVPTPAQANMIKDLRDRGETVYVIDNVADFKRVLQREIGIRRRTV